MIIIVSNILPNSLRQGLTGLRRASFSPLSDWNYSHLPLCLASEDNCLQIHKVIDAWTSSRTLLIWFYIGLVFLRFGLKIFLWLLFLSVFPHIVFMSVSSTWECLWPYTSTVVPLWAGHCILYIVTTFKMLMICKVKHKLIWIISSLLQL